MKIIANKKSKIYHHETCYFGQLILEKNRRVIDNEFLEHEINNYRPCSKCKPVSPNQTSLEEYAVATS